MNEKEKITKLLQETIEKIVNSHTPHRAEYFQQEFDDFRSPADVSKPLDAFGFRLTAAPVLDEVRLDTVLSNGGLSRELRKPWVTVNRQTWGISKELRDLSSYGLFFLDWKPQLRAARAIATRGPGDELYQCAYNEVHCDGLIEMGFVSRCMIKPLIREEEPAVPLYEEVLISMFASLVAWADKIRKQARAPKAKYAIEVEIKASKDVSVKLDKEPYSRMNGNLPPSSKKFPGYSFSNAKENSRLTSKFERDFWNYLGQDFEGLQGTLEIESV